MAITSQTMIERADYQIAVAAQDVGAADVTGSYYSMKDFNRVLANAVCDAVTADDTLTVKLVQATDDSGSDSKDLTAATTVTATGAEALLAQVEAKASDLDSGFTHVAAVVGASANGTVAAATLVRGDGTYRP